MSPYALELAHARIDALRALIDAMNEAETPEEKRRCAVAIFNAPEPNDFDDEIELVDDDDDESDDADESENNSDPDEDSEEEALSSPQPRSASTSDIAHSTSHISPALLDHGTLNPLAAPLEHASNVLSNLSHHPRGTVSESNGAFP